jgi:hypothetical protein
MLKLSANKLKSSLDSWLQIKQRLALIDSDREGDAAHKNLLKKLVQNGHSVIGYVPYVAGKTELLIFNFFAANYGVRSKSSAVISLTDKNFKSIHSSIHELGFRSNISYKPKFLDNNHHVVFCTVLIVNESIRRNHGSHNGHLRFWGAWSNFSAFTHSMPIPQVYSQLFRKLRPQHASNKIYDRRFFPRELTQADHFSFQDGAMAVGDRGDLSPHFQSEMGFSLLRSHESQVCGCYHNSPFSRDAITSFREVEHIVALPNAPSIDALLFFGECCKPGAKFLVSLFKSDNEVNPIEETEIEIKSLDAVRLSTLFPAQIFSCEKPLWVKFKSYSGQHRDYYVNIVYASKDNQALFDGVHSHSFSKQSGRSLKFAPFKVSDQLDQNPEIQADRKSSLAIWGHESQDIKYRLRIFSDSDQNFELVYQHSIKAKSVKFVDLADLLGKSYPKSEFFFVQLESEESNLNASLFSWLSSGDDSLESLCVDHLTGG